MPDRNQKPFCKYPPVEQRSCAQKVRQIFFAYVASMLFAFTGGNMTLPLLQRQLDDKYGLMHKDRVLEFNALGQTLPGVISLNVGILIGRSIAGWPGAFAAAAGCVLPAFFGMLIITFSYTLLSRLTFITGFIDGIRAASVAIILQTGILVLGMKKNAFYYLLAAAAFACTLFLGWNIVVVVLLCGFAGVVREIVKSKKQVP
ncbi:MAG: chromate transporter [Bacillota bacterium]